MKNLVMMLLLPLLSFTSCCVQQEIPLSPEEMSTIEDEVDARFQKMLKLVRTNEQEEFETYFDEAATLAVAGFEIPSKSVKSYAFEVFKSLADDDVDFVLTHYALSKYIFYLDVYAFRKPPTDTTRGIPLKPYPMTIGYLSKKDAANYKTSEQRIGTVNYHIVHSDTTQYMKPTGFVFPIKEEKFTIIFTRNTQGWQFTHGHLSLAIKRSKIFNLKEVKPE